MNRKEKMISSHNTSLSSIFGDRLSSLRFDTYIPSSPIDNDTVVSDNKEKKIAVITRHYLDSTCGCTHTIILEKEWYSRL